MTESLVGRRVIVRDIPDLFNRALVGKTGSIVADTRGDLLGQITVHMDALYLTAEQAVAIADEVGLSFNPRRAYFDLAELELTSC